MTKEIKPGGVRLPTGLLRKSKKRPGAEGNMAKEESNKLTYIIYCIDAFGEKYDLMPKQAYAYLKRYGGISFIDECYAAEHTLSLEDAVSDMSVVCRKNGGGLG